MSFPRYPNYKDSGVEWLREVPGHWDIRRVRWLCEIKKRIAGELGYDVLSITQQGIRIKDLESNDGQLSMDYSKYQFVEVGDFAMNHMDLLTGYVDISNVRGVTSPDYRVFTIRDAATCHDKYLLYLFQMGYKNRIFYAYGQGSSQLGRWRLPTEQFNDLRFPLPPKSEQQSIAAFLDRETAKIDALVVEQRRLMELLKEKRQAVISHAVTQGLNPHAPMKPSGIEWLGDVPAHWEVWKLAHAFAQIGSGTTPRTDKREYYEDGDIPWINTGDLNDGDLEDCEKRVTSLALADHTSLKIYPTGSVLIAMYGATIGKLAILRFPATVNQACCIFADSSQIETEFMFYLFLGLRKHILSLATGGGQPNVSQEILRSLRVAAPCHAEQKEVTDFLDRETGRIDTLTVEAQRAIDLLQERRTALISAAVTGQIDVCGLAAASAVSPEATCV